MHPSYNGVVTNFHPGDFIFDCNGRKVQVPDPRKGWDYKYPAWYVLDYLTNGRTLQPNFELKQAKKAVKKYRPKKSLKFSVNIKLSVTVRKELTDFLKEIENGPVGLAEWVFDLTESMDDSPAKHQHYLAFVRGVIGSVLVPQPNSPAMTHYRDYLEIVRLKVLPEAKNSLSGLEVLLSSNVADDIGITSSDVAALTTEIEAAEQELKKAEQYFNRYIKRLKDRKAGAALVDLNQFANVTPEVLEEVTDRQGTTVEAVFRLIQAVSVQTQIAKNGSRIKKVLKFEPLDER